MGEQTRFFWNKWRTRFRRFRMCVHLLVLTLACLVLWLNQIGLPEFAKRPLIQALHDRGIDLQFVRLRLNFIHGLVADNVRIGGATPDSPSINLQEVQLQLNYSALLHRQFQLDGVVLRQGKFVLPVSESNEPPCTLTVDHIQTDLRFQTNDVWTLDDLQADFAGAKFILSGELRNAQSVTNWQIFHRQQAVRGVPPGQLKKIAYTLGQIHFDSGSQLNLRVSGDGRDTNSLSLFLAVNAPGADTPWGSVSNLELVAHSVPNPPDVPAPPIQIEWKVQLRQLKTEKLQARFVSCAGSWRVPDNIACKVELAQLESQKLNANFISCIGSWHPPELQVTNLYARLGSGELHAVAQLNTSTREFSFTNSSCFDLQAVTALLTEKFRARLDQFSFPQPPELQASGSMILPDWTNLSPDSWSNVKPTVRLDGKLAVTNAAFSGVSLNVVHARFSYSNEIWTLPQTVITRSESSLEIAGTENDATKDYQWHIHGALVPDFIQPFLTPKAARGFTNFVFTQPVFLDTDVRGRLYDYDSINATGHAALTNFSIRGESVDHVETDFRYAHLVADFLQPRLQAGAQNMRADGVRLDWPGDRVYFTNGFGTADPQAVANAIGPIPAQDLKPYTFPALPTARVNGYAPLRDPTNADLDFKVVGTAQLRCLKLYTPAISGEIHWIGQSLILTNLSASLYGGNGTANATFDFRPHNGANFNFIADLTNVNIHPAATDLSSPTNHLEGRLTGHFVMTSASSLNWRSCNGYGRADLRDGLLWDVPIFGIFSLPLNAISPGMGNSRATDASADFFMTNGVISTDNLIIRTSLMRLHYNGTVDLKGNLDADVTAELLRDIPVIGSILGPALLPVGELFKCKVYGTWKDPHAKPIRIPRLLRYMLHPIHSLENWLPPNDNQTNMLKQPTPPVKP